MTNLNAQPRNRMLHQMLQYYLRLLLSPVMRSWHGLIWLLTVVSFVSLLASAVTHQHHSTLEDRACTVCSTVSGHMPDITAPVQLTVNTALVLICVLLSLPATSRRTGRRCLPPPICGPPQRI